MPKFFIERPIFAWVIAIITMLAGLLAIIQLPVSQYPTIAPPAVSISANYPGADAETVQNTVTQVIEQNMNGIDNLVYMSSSSDSSGSASITITFEAGTDGDIAQVQVQNKLQLAMPLLPQEVQQQGISVDKSTSSFLMVAGFVSNDGSMGQYDIADYVGSNIKDPLSRVNGVGETQLFGTQYAMRIWLKPEQLVKYNMTTTDVINAIKVQNNQVAAGQLGGSPSIANQRLNVSIIAQTRLNNAEEFSNILLRVNQDGSQVRIKDVADVELGAENYSTIARFNGKPAAGIGIKLATGANALDTSNNVRAALEDMKPFFPQGLEIVYPYDTTPFVKISINEVVKTLVEAIMLVVVVMYLFLQNIRATLIPTIAVPVVLLGTFAILSAFGYSINTLTMFAMVLAIGLLVDDAIVVVENVERVMQEEGLSPKEATKKSMGQIQGALVGIAMVLSAVFIPMAFFGGSTGAIYRQFSITIVSSMVFSVLVAMILTPALCATMLKPIEKGSHGSQKGFFGWFNRMFEKQAHHYTDSVSRMLNGTGRYLVIYLILVAGMAFMFVRLPSSFLPAEDQGVFLSMIQLPPGSTQEQTQAVLDEVNNYYLTEEKANVESVFTVGGFSFAGQGQNMGLAFIVLKNWSERKGDENHVDAIVQRANIALSQKQEALIYAFNLPAIVELGTADGFDFELVDKANLGHEKLMEARNQLLGLAAQHPEMLQGVRPNGQDDTSQYRIYIDQQKAQAQGVAISDINATLSSIFGGAYVNDFIDRGRVKKV
ncbi:efflux RND transporter permease subunit, partial [Providencia huashanensis]|uniref:efflux RND transporter permease subunit n=2 Tax=Providencia TaxID=586 RepID=UPI004045C6E4